jgi:serine/threonine-protein kinase
VPEPRRRKPASRYGAGNVIADKYRLGQKLGEGGMGEVWRAHNDTLDIDVAIKLIRGEVANSEMADRLLHEARAAARLGHPAIVRINDFGRTALGDPYIVMELLAGEDLASALQQRGRFSAIKAIRTLLPIAHALTVAHTKGIVHRDLKPENVFLARTDDGAIQPKLVDFGVAKLELPQAHRITQSGALLGSPLYMSPEQARGDDVDHRADVWALGVVLYEAITGRPPFEGKNYNAIIYSIIANPPTPVTDFGVGDDELWSVLDRALQKDPDRRWYSMRDFGEALARWLGDRDIHEDITGTSLQTTWFSSRHERDVLRAPSIAPPSGPETLKPLPPVPTIATGAGEAPATRNDRKVIAAVAVGAGLLALGVTLAIATSNKNQPSEGERPAAASSAVDRARRAPATEASEHAPSTTVSAAPAQADPTPAAATAEPPKRKTASRAARAARPVDTSTPQQRPRVLKNPFQ